jgi:hypothetical protein
MTKMNDSWFADKFIKISEDLGGIKENQDTMFKQIKRNCDIIEVHDQRLSLLETRDTVKEEEQLWHKRHPLATGMTLGGISIGSLLTLVVAILKAIGII